MSSVLIRGGGDLASGVAACLYRKMHKVLITELNKPATVRREVSFSEAIYNGQTTVEEIKGSHAKSFEEINLIFGRGEITVLIDPDLKILEQHSADYLIDARMLKRKVKYDLGGKQIIIGLGPGFLAGENCDFAVETMRGPSLGDVIRSGRNMDDTGIPGEIGHRSAERVMRAPSDGEISHLKKIGDLVAKDEVISEVGGIKITALFDGVIRGLIHPGFIVTKGMKVGDIDPRNDVDLCFSISDKAMKIGKSVLGIVEGEFNK
jgi:xanthine dehydrogenase accessory factor